MKPNKNHLKPKKPTLTNKNPINLNPRKTHIKPQNFCENIVGCRPKIWFFWQTNKGWGLVSIYNIQGKDGREDYEFLLHDGASGLEFDHLSDDIYGHVFYGDEAEPFDKDDSIYDVRISDFIQSHTVVPHVPTVRLFRSWKFQRQKNRS